MVNAIRESRRSANGQPAQDCGKRKDGRRVVVAYKGPGEWEVKNVSAELWQDCKPCPLPEVPPL